MAGLEEIFPNGPCFLLCWFCFCFTVFFYSQYFALRCDFGLFLFVFNLLHLGCGNINPVYRDIVIDADNQAAPSVNNRCFYQVGAVGGNLDGDYRGFDFKFSGVGDIGNQKGGFFPGGFVEVSVEGFHFFFIGPARF